MKKKIVAMLLAGGQGSRLGVLTSNMAKPAVPYGGKYRIIDFPLSNCVNSDIDTVGVLTQYRPLALNSYIGTGQHWDLDRQNGGVFVLPPYMTGSDGHWYSGTANAIYQNREFVDQYHPDYVLILSGDHIYKMDYAKMLAFHVQKQAAATIAVLPVPIQEAHRFGIMSTDAHGRITKFEEKPAHPDSNNASMGIYIFNWPTLKRFMEHDDADPASEHDFGKTSSRPCWARASRCSLLRSRGIGRMWERCRASGRRIWISSPSRPGSSSTILRGASTAATRSCRRTMSAQRAALRAAW